MTLLRQIVVAGYYKKALIAVCLCIALFAAVWLIMSHRGQEAWDITGHGIVVRGQRSEVGSQRSEAGGQKSEVRYQMSEVRGWKSEVGSQESEVGGQKSEVGSQVSEVESQRSEIRGHEPIGSVKKSFPVTASMEEQFEYFNYFIVYLKDDHRKNRVLTCDVVIELNQGMKLPQKRIELRKIIYNTLKKLSGLPETKRGLKEKIKSSLNNFMDDEIIKDVYFTKFVLL